MKRIGYLFEEVSSFGNLYLAARQVLRGRKKIFHDQFYFLLEKKLLELQYSLIDGSYKPGKYKSFEIREPKPRVICSSPIQDRIIHHSICHVLDPVFEKRFISDTYACRVGKGMHRAVLRAKAMVQNSPYYLKCDIKKYFYSIDHQVLKNLLSRIIKDEALFSLLATIIDHQVPGCEVGRGLPIGNLTSQYFANLYLGELDHFLKDLLGVKRYLRYMDDFLLFSDDKSTLKNFLVQIKKFLEENLRLELKEKATILSPIQEGVPFLGYRIFPHLIRLQRANLVRLRKNIFKKETAYVRGIISEVEMQTSVASMVAHVKIANSTLAKRKFLKHSWFMA